MRCGLVLLTVGLALSLPADLGLNKKLGSSARSNRDTNLNDLEFETPVTSIITIDEADNVAGTPLSPELPSPKKGVEAPADPKPAQTKLEVKPEEKKSDTPNKKTSEEDATSDNFISVADLVRDLAPILPQEQPQYTYIPAPIYYSGIGTGTINYVPIQNLIGKDGKVVANPTQSSGKNQEPNKKLESKLEDSKDKEQSNGESEEDINKLANQFSPEKPKSDDDQVNNDKENIIILEGKELKGAEKKFATGLLRQLASSIQILVKSIAGGLFGN